MNEPITKVCDSLQENSQAISAAGDPSAGQPAGDETAVISDNYQSARMSHNRLKSLNGFGYRHCYMEKFREVADTGVSVERWAAKSAKPFADSEDEKIRKVRAAILRATCTRLAAYEPAKSNLLSSL